MSFSNKNLVNRDYVYSIPAGSRIEVKEKNAAGAGKCVFHSQHDVIFIQSRDNSPVVWCLENKKCAEAAFCVLRERNSVSLHIIEMKSNLTLEGFNKVIEQVSGMYLSALAAISIIQSPPPRVITAYVAYKKDKISPPPATLITNKTLVGEGELPGMKEWRTKELSLPHNRKAKIIVGERVSGSVNFGEVV